MTEEKYLLEKCGRENHFKVPEGYFEGVSSDVMSSIRKAHGRRKPMFRVLRPYIAAAACLLIAIFSINVYIGRNAADTEVQAQWQLNESYIDDVMDYAMLDNGDLYACMAEE